jgi:hypothetical protein
MFRTVAGFDDHGLGVLVDVRDHTFYNVNDVFLSRNSLCCPKSQDRDDRGHQCYPKP